MLFITYGLQKSASTFAFRLAHDIAWTCGHDHAALSGRFLPSSARGGYLDCDGFPIRELAEAVPRDQVLVIKTHSALSDDIRSCLVEGAIRASATFRDPRDAAVSVLDAALKATLEGKDSRFGEVHTIVDAIDLIAENLPITADWLANPHVIQVPFDLLAANPMSATHRMAVHMGVQVDPAEIVAPYLTGQIPIPEFNKGLRGRHRYRMTTAELAYATRRFGEHIHNFDHITNGILGSDGVTLVPERHHSP